MRLSILPDWLQRLLFGALVAVAFLVGGEINASARPSCEVQSSARVLRASAGCRARLVDVGATRARRVIVPAGAVVERSSWGSQPKG